MTEELSESTMLGAMKSRVRELREARDMSRERLAADAGLSVRTIENAERGSLPRVRTALRIAEVLGVGIADLFVFDEVAS